MLNFCQTVVFIGFIGIALSSMDINEATSTIKEHVKSYDKKSFLKASDVLCDQYSCCSISETETCPITGFTKDETSLVLPGGNTRCLLR